jgi:Zn-dependent peptidase ImmA (M78 family)
VPLSSSTLAHMVLGATGYLDTFRARPAVDVAGLLEDYELVWRIRPLGRFGGALILLDADYYILTNSLLPPARQRLVAAHELGHYLMHRGKARLFLCGTDDRSIPERQAERFAAELLMPVEMVYWLRRRGLGAPGDVARVLGVSVEAAARRLAELGLNREEIGA